jgi:hypothetical protein
VANVEGSLGDLEAAEELAGCGQAARDMDVDGVRIAAIPRDIDDHTIRVSTGAGGSDRHTGPAGQIRSVLDRLGGDIAIRIVTTMEGERQVGGVEGLGQLGAATRCERISIQIEFHQVGEAVVVGVLA